jgi:hypothetical protein
MEQETASNTLSDNHPSKTKKHETRVSSQAETTKKKKKQKLLFVQQSRNGTGVFCDERFVVVADSRLL